MRGGPADSSGEDVSSTAAQVLRRRWQAPRSDGGLLDSPRLAEAGNVAARNRDLLLGSSVVIDGQPLAALRSKARSESLLAGRRFLSDLSGGQFAAAAPW